MKTTSKKWATVALTVAMLSGCAEKSAPSTQTVPTVTFTVKETSFLKDTTTDILIDDNNFRKEDIVKIVKHGDHWHVFTKDGREHITYVDPASSEGELELVSVVSLSALKNKAVRSIKKHGNHWHVYTEDGEEFLTYEDPSSTFKNIAIGEYSEKDSAKERGSSTRGGQKVNGDEIVKILIHGNHYHLYTADNQEFITYSDPRGKYPNAVVGVYQGSHDSPAVSNHSKPSSDTAKDGSSGTAPSLPGAQPEKEGPDFIIQVLSLQDLASKKIVKILHHEGHYHCYTAEEKEYITYGNPRSLFPNASYGEYEGSHGDNAPKKPLTGEDQDDKWPEGITMIVDHGDHWHLYRDGKEVCIVTVNPHKRYPNAEYIDERENNHAEIELKEEDLFRYEEIEAEVVSGVIPYLGDLKNMTHFGNLQHTDYPVMGTHDREDIFYWLHGNHYHAMSIRDIIRRAKASEYGNHSARQVVATVKAKIEKGAKLLETVDAARTDAVKKYLQAYYDTDRRDVWNIGNIVSVYLEKTGKQINFNALSDFDYNDGVVTPKVDLSKHRSPLKEENVEEAPVPNAPTPESESPSPMNPPISDEKPGAEESDEALVKKYAQMYQLSEEAFEELFWNLPSVSIRDIRFFEDGTCKFMYKGEEQTYHFLKGEKLS